MENNIKYIIETINNKITESQRTDIIQTQTDEQRRIAALEGRVGHLSTQVSLLQSALTLPADHDAKLSAILDYAASLPRA